MIQNDGSFNKLGFGVLLKSSMRQIIPNDNTNKAWYKENSELDSNWLPNVTILKSSDVIYSINIIFKIFLRLIVFIDRLEKMYIDKNSTIKKMITAISTKRL